MSRCPKKNSTSGTTDPSSPRLSMRFRFVWRNRGQRTTRVESQNGADEAAARHVYVSLGVERRAPTSAANRDALSRSWERSISQRRLGVGGRAEVRPGPAAPA